MRDFQRFAVWQRCHALTLAVYGATARFPSEERFGLAGALRKTAISVESNLAEGCGRSTDADFARFLDIAGGSLNELETQLLIAIDVGFLEDKELTDQIRVIRRMLYRLTRRLRTPPS